MAVFAAPALTIPFLLFSGFFVTLSSIPVYMQWITYLSFIRYSFQGSMVSIYAYDRANLNCTQPYCHFKVASKFLEQFDMHNASYLCSLSALLTLFLCIRILAFFVLRCKMANFR